jgi:hypothetical protein
MFELMATIRPEHLRRAEWVISLPVWQSIKTDPAFACDWLDEIVTGGRRGGTLRRTLLGLPVQLTAAELTPVLITVPLDCRER